MENKNGKNTSKNTNTNKNTNKNKNKTTPFSIKRMQIRQLFSIPSLTQFDDYEESENQNKILITEIQNLPDVIDPTQFGEVQDGFAYIQMKLDGSKINEDFIKKMESRINKNVVVREAMLDDIPILVELYNRAFLTSHEPYAPMTEEKMAAIFHYNNTIILIGELYGKPVGFIIIDFEGKNKEKGIIAGLGILPKYQKKRIGTTLGVVSWKYFKKYNVKELLCEVFIKNKASYKLISGMGFVPTGIKYYKNE
ncbi:MAG: GNAT family N-acetyltransferase [Promethearchaeota archaeon]